MAAKNSHVQDNSVAERRLRPIYEWLDSGNPKKALQETDKVLKKTPNLQCAKALKALSLLQLNRESECVNILTFLTEESPSDNATLQAMTICYRDLNQLDKVCTLYENAVQIEQNNEELFTHLFMSYVRTNNFKLQQQTAMSLYKMKNKNPYYCWAVMSIVLQATRGPGSSDSNKKNVLLALAERMIVKLIGENKLEAEQEVQLYLMILELQKKYAEALEVLDGPLGAKLMCTSTDLSRIKYLIELKKWPEMTKHCMELLNANIDRWDIWNYYLTAMFESVTCESNSNLEEIVDKIHEFISSLIENISGDNIFESGTAYHYKLRGPYLARFELYKRLKNLKYNPGELLGDVFELFVEYFRIFGHKSCVVNDLKIYLHLLREDRQLLLAARLLGDVGITETLLPTTEKQMKRHIGAIQLSRLLGNHVNCDAQLLRNLFLAFLLHLKHGEQFAEGKLLTDQGPADAYALISAHVLFDLSRKLNHSEPLVRALVFLEAVLEKSPSNFHAKLLAVRLYHILGAPLGAHFYYEALDAKHLQLDSLGFVHCGLMYTTGNFSLTSAIFDSTLKFFSTNYRDSVDHLTFSYKFGSFLKLEEFMNFREKLNNSLHYVTTAIDKMLLDVVLCTNIKTLSLSEPKSENIHWDELSDNNDYSVYVNWNPDTENSTDILFQENKSCAQLRAAILYCISCALDYLKNAHNPEHNAFRRDNNASSRATNAENHEHNPSSCVNNVENHEHHLSNHKHNSSSCVNNAENRDNNASNHEHNTSRRATNAHNRVTNEPNCEHNASNAHKQLKQSLSDFINKLHQLKQKNAHVLGDRLLSDPLPSRLHKQLSLPWEQTIGTLINLLLSNNKQTAETSETFKKCLNNIVDKIKAIVTRENCEDSLYTRRNNLEHIVNYLELISICCVLAGINYEVLRPQPAKKSKKRAPAPPDAAPTKRAREELFGIINALIQACTQLEQLLGNLKPPQTSKDLLEQFGALQISSGDVCSAEVQENVLKNIKNSHATTMSELKTLLLGKIKFLNTLNC